MARGLFLPNVALLCVFGLASGCPAPSTADLPCNTESDCPAGNKCEKGQCQALPCTINKDCDDGRICLTNLCVRQAQGENPDAGSSLDAGEPLDAGSTPDAGSGDAGPGDAGPDDAGTPLDASPFAEAGPNDSGQAVDSGPSMDAGVDLDAGGPTDGHVDQTDGSMPIDAGQPVDAGMTTTTDSGSAILDAGSSADSGLLGLGEPCEIHSECDGALVCGRDDLLCAYPDSCAGLHLAKPVLGNGDYLLSNSTRPNPFSAHCDMETDGGGWTRVVDFQEGEDCPSSEWISGPAGVGCIRDPGAANLSRTTAHFGPNVDSYQEVRGTIQGFSYGSPDMFKPPGGDISEAYVDGISVVAFTSSQPQGEHVWTYAAAWSEDSNNQGSVCPCELAIVDGGFVHQPNGFVGSDYYCESANTGLGNTGQEYWHLDDPLWDDGCGATGDAPGFQTTLSSPSTALLDVAILLDQGVANENISISRMQLWVR